MYVNPDRPDQAVLNVEVAGDRWSHAIALVVAGVLVAVVGLVVIWLQA